MLMGQRHQLVMMDMWDGVGWCGARHPPALSSAWVSQGCVAGGGCCGAVRQEESSLGLPLWSMQSREVLQSASWRS